jgi:hypothetical protein
MEKVSTMGKAPKVGVMEKVSTMGKVPKVERTPMTTRMGNQPGMCLSTSPPIQVPLRRGSTTVRRTQRPVKKRRQRNQEQIFLPIKL